MMINRSVLVQKEGEQQSHMVMIIDIIETIA